MRAQSRLLLPIFVLAAALLVGGRGEAWSAFPGRNGAIAVSAGTPLMQYATNLYVLGAGGKPRVLPCGEPVNLRWVCLDFSAAFSPDGRLLARTSDTVDPEGRIVLSAADGSGPRVLKVPGTPRSTGWAPDGQSILYTAGTYLPSGTTIETVALDGSGAHEVTREGGDPSWSTRGWIAFTRDPPGYANICRVRPDGTRRRCLTRRGGEQPDWSPHGTRIAFQRLVRNSRGREEWRVYTMRTNGAGLRQLDTHGPAHSPAWSPDGKWIAFVRPGPGDANRLYKVRLNGKRLTRLSTQQGLADPDWQPLN